MFIRRFLSFNDMVIFENKNFIVINKPYNLSVHGGSKSDNNLIQIIKSYYNSNSIYIQLAHRIDKDTSGCLVLAKSKKFLINFQKALSLNTIEREYHALVKGSYLNLNSTKFSDSVLNNYNVKIFNKGRMTENYYDLIKSFLNCSLIKIFPFTGKMHQIRIHLSYIGNPIACDFKYGSKKFNIEMKSQNLNRMFLHFKSIKFKCPVDDVFYFINSDYDKNLFNFIKKINGV